MSDIFQKILLMTNNDTLVWKNESVFGWAVNACARLGTFVFIGSEYKSRPDDSVKMYEDTGTRYPAFIGSEFVTGIRDAIAAQRKRKELDRACRLENALRSAPSHRHLR